MQAHYVFRRLIAVSVCIFTFAAVALFRFGFSAQADPAHDRPETALKNSSAPTGRDGSTDPSEAIKSIQRTRTRSPRVEYTGDQKIVDALQMGQVEARSITFADFDGDATPDVVAGYKFGTEGIITIQRGNPDAFAPKDDSVFTRMHEGYDPDSLLPAADTYAVPASVDFLQAGDFNNDHLKDLLAATRGGGLFLLAGDGTGKFRAAEVIPMPGPVIAMASGEFRAADGRTDLAISIVGPMGHSVLIFDGSIGIFNPEPFLFQFTSEVTAIEFGDLDGDPFMDIAVANGSGVDLIHGWGRKVDVDLGSRIERIELGGGPLSIAVDNFLWDRQGTPEIAALFEDGSVLLFEHSRVEDQPYSEHEMAEREGLRSRVVADANRNVDVESLGGWPSVSDAGGWRQARQLASDIDVSRARAQQTVLAHGNLFGTETNPLLILDAGRNTISAISQFRDKEISSLKPDTTLSGDIATRIFQLNDAPATAVIIPKKLNGVQDVVVLGSGEASPDILVFPPNTTITVDRTDDPSGAALTAASACTAAGNDCSLRGALQFANLPQNDNTTISLPANTYILSINGTNQGGCDGNTVGDLGANRTMSIVGAGAATTIIRQTGTGPANDGDRIMCMNEPFTIGLIYNFSGVTFVGGREGTAAGTGTVLGGAGIIGGELNNALTMTNVVMANNQETVAGSANLGGGGIQITGGNLTITNSTFGGTSLPGAYADRSSTTTGNLQTGSGGGVAFTPSSPQHAGGTGILTITGSTFSRNTAAGIGGGGADLFIFAFAAPGGIGSGSATIGTSTFSNNVAMGAGATGAGGGILVESLPTTVATTSLTNNSAGNRGGGIFVGGGSLLLNGTTPSITFSGNTATSGGTSVSTSSAVTVSGTNTTIGGSIEVNTLGSWTNNAGSTLSPTDVVVTGGTFNMNNSTMNVSGNMTIGPGPVVGSTFNGNTGTVNIAGNLTTNAGGAGPATTFNGGTGTFNFNGAVSQSISGTLSPTFGSLTDSNTTQPLAINNSIVVNGTLNVNGANATLAPAAASVISGTGTLTGNGTARVTRTAATAGFVNQYTITNKVLTNLLVDYVGTSTQVLSAITYGPLRINNATGVNLAAGTSTVDGLLTLTSGALGVGTNTLVINNGTSVGSGSITSSATGTVNYNQGSAGQDVRAFNYGNLTFSNQNKVLANAGTIGIAGTFTNGTAVGHTITGSTINFNGGGAQTIPAFNYNNLTSSGAGARTLANVGTIGVAGAFTPGTNVYTITGSTIDFNGAGAQTIAAFNYNNLTSSNVGARTLANAGTIGIANVFTAGTNTYTITGSTVNFNGNVAQAIPAFNFNNLTSSGTGARTLPNGGTVRIAGAFTPGTNVFTVTGSTIEHNGSALQTIPAFTYNNFVLNNAAGANLGGIVTVGGSLTLTIGALNVGTNTLTLNGVASATGGTLTSAATGTVNYNQGSNGQAVLNGTYGNLTFSNFTKDLTNRTISISGVFTPGTAIGHTITGSTFIYNGTSAQTLPSGFANYNNLTLNNPAGVTGFAGLTVQGLLRVQAGTFISSSTYNNVQIDSGATLAGVAATTINVSGNWTNNGTFTASGNTVNFNGSAPQTIGGTSGTTFNNLTINNAAGVNLGANATVGGTLALSVGAFGVGANTLTLNGATTSSGGSLTSAANGTVNYNQGSDGQSILSANYGNLTFSNFNKNLTNANVGIAGTLTPGTAGGHVVTGSTITFNGIVPQNAPVFPYNNLTINDPAGVTLAGNIDVIGELALQNGIVNAGDFTMTLSPNATASRGGTCTIASCFVANNANAGGLRKQFGAGATAAFVYPMGTTGGTDNGYSPVELANITAASAGDSLTVRAVDAVSPAPISSEKITRYWELTETGGITTDLTFRYLAGDDDAVTVPGALGILRGSSPVCSPACVDEANLTATMTGVFDFSPWTMAVLIPTAASVSVSGRVTDANGRGISRARLTLVDAAGQTRVAMTSTFGYYRFVNVVVGETYILSVSAKRYTFAQPTIVLNVLDELTDVNFVGEH